MLALRTSGLADSGLFQSYQRSGLQELGLAASRFIYVSVSPFLPPRLSNHLLCHTPVVPLLSAPERTGKAENLGARQRDRDGFTEECMTTTGR